MPSCARLPMTHFILQQLRQTFYHGGWYHARRKRNTTQRRKDPKNKEAIYQIIKTLGHLCVKLFVPLREKNNLHSKPQRKKLYNISAIEETLYQGKCYLLMKHLSCHLQRTFLSNQKLITLNDEGKRQLKCTY